MLQLINLSVAANRKDHINVITYYLFRWHVHYVPPVSESIEVHDKTSLLLLHHSIKLSADTSVPAVICYHVQVHFQPKIISQLESIEYNLLILTCLLKVKGCAGRTPENSHDTISFN